MIWQTCGGLCRALAAGATVVHLAPGSHAATAFMLKGYPKDAELCRGAPLVVSGGLDSSHSTTKSCITQACSSMQHDFTWVLRHEFDRDIASFSFECTACKGRPHERGGWFMAQKAASSATAQKTPRPARCNGMQYSQPLPGRFSGNHPASPVDQNQRDEILVKYISLTSGTVGRQIRVDFKTRQP